MNTIFSALILLSCYSLEYVRGQSSNAPLGNQLRQQTSSQQLPQSLTSNKIKEAFKSAAENVANQRTIDGRRPFDRSDDTAALRHSIFQAGKLRTKQMAAEQEVFEEATRLLSKEFRLSSEQIANALPVVNLTNILQDDTLRNCQAFSAVTNCNSNDRYRTFDGSCNNRQNPTWGMAATCFQRLVKPFYADGVFQLRRAVSGRALPNPRTISLQIHPHLDIPTDYVTHMFMQWGQFLDHDFALSPLSSAENNLPLNCCPVENNAPMQCAPILIEANDPFYSRLRIRCLNNARTQICSTCSLGPREQTNQLTSFIDASQVYGTTVNDSRGLRTLNGGLMRNQVDSDSGELLPPSNDPQNDQCSDQDPNLNCFQAGDPRVNQHPALVSIHTIFLREHNRVAQILRTLNRNWNDERIFQETRRIIGAQMQMITYNEFLPLVIGHERMDYFHLHIRQGGYTQYDPEVDPTILHEFATAAYRFGHSMINTFFPEVSRERNTTNQLRNIFLFPFGIFSGQLDRIVRGLALSPAQKFDRWMVPDVTNHLYQMRGNQSGLDLAALNVLRGRDHGIPPYVKMVDICGGPKIMSFRNLSLVFQREYIPLFQRVYESVEDIDFFSGGLAEIPNQGAVVGPTFTCVIGMQFNHLKYGDRFYFEHSGQVGSFTPAQLDELRKTTFAKIICDNTNIDELQPWVMLYPGYPIGIRNLMTSCRQLPQVNLAAWRQ